MTNRKCPAAEAKLGKSNKTEKHSTNLTAQRARILSHLQKGKTLTTLQAREELDIMHPGGRIMELRHRGWPIKMHWVTVDTPLGKHRIGKYFLSGGSQ